MVGYMKRYEVGKELVKETRDRFRASRDLVAITFARAQGFCGDRVSGLDTPMDRSEEPIPQATAAGPDWLPKEVLRPYLSYLQQYTHTM